MNHFQTVLRELREHLHYLERIITMSTSHPSLKQAQYIALDVYCRENAEDVIYAGYRSIKKIPLHEMATFRRDIESALNISVPQVEVLDDDTPSSEAPHPEAARPLPTSGGDEGDPSGEPQSPPDNFDAAAMSEDLQCPICYRRVVDSGFTQCQHRLCPHCLEQYVRGYGRRCPLCRQGDPTDTVLAEVARILKFVEPMYALIEE